MKVVNFDENLTRKEEDNGQRGRGEQKMSASNHIADCFEFTAFWLNDQYAKGTMRKLDAGLFRQANCRLPSQKSFHIRRNAIDELHLSGRDVLAVVQDYNRAVLARIERHE